MNKLRFKSLVVGLIYIFLTSACAVTHPTAGGLGRLPPQTKAEVFSVEKNILKTLNSKKTLDAQRADQLPSEEDPSSKQPIDQAPSGYEYSKGESPDLRESKTQNTFGEDRSESTDNAVRLKVDQNKQTIVPVGDDINIDSESQIGKKSESEESFYIYIPND